MDKMGKSRRKRKDRWGNRMTIIGITFVVFSLAVIVTIKGVTLKEKEREYELHLENLQAQVDKEEERSQKLEEYRVYVQTKQYIEEVAKQKLGLVNPDEILLKPSRRQ
ncbi:septum formation initiator family protein [Lacrimispora sp.]|uniref:septum formation initiator family protein n=1 Tax=Lacrimispora sp. TaxID=2719234 RepID=UPI0028AB6CCF|nr:septum formation initiator family protein [Lacrimispora sp.]